jgi:hypothetical protein
MKMLLDNNEEFTYTKSLIFYYKREGDLIKKVIYKIDNETYYFMEFSEVNKNYFLSDFPRKLNKNQVIDLLQKERIEYQNISTEELLNAN